MGLRLVCVVCVCLVCGWKQYLHLSCGSCSTDSMFSFVQFLEKLLNPADEQRPRMFLLDCASVHPASAFRQQLHSQLPLVKSIYIPGGSTAYNQLLDRSMMKSFKSAIVRKSSRHFSERILLVDRWTFQLASWNPSLRNGFMRSSKTSHPDGISDCLGPHSPQ